MQETQETQETEVRSLGQEDPLEKEMAAHSSIFSWKSSFGQKSLVGSSPRGGKIRTWLSTAHARNPDQGPNSLRFYEG